MRLELYFGKHLCDNAFRLLPLSADQLMNSRYLDDIEKVGFALCYLKAENQDHFNNITKHEEEKAVRKLMDGKTSAEARRNIAELQKSAAAAVAVGRSSCRNLHTFLDEIANS